MHIYNAQPILIYTVPYNEELRLQLIVSSGRLAPALVTLIYDLHCVPPQILELLIGDYPYYTTFGTLCSTDSDERRQHLVIFP